MYSKSANSVYSITSDHFDVKSFLPGIARYTRKKPELCVKVDGCHFKHSNNKVNVNVFCC